MPVCLQKQELFAHPARIWTIDVLPQEKCKLAVKILLPPALPPLFIVSALVHSMAYKMLVFSNTVSVLTVFNGTMWYHPIMAKITKNFT
jgi:hypothetical protein